MRVFGIAGRSGSGKTSLVVRLIPELAGRGLRVSTIKQARPDFEPDSAGKDSWRHRHAGAQEVLVVSSTRWALVHESRPPAEPVAAELLARLDPVDLVLVEGFRDWPHPRLEVVRPALGLAPLFPDDPRMVAVAADAPLPGCPLPCLDLNDSAAIAAFILAAAGM